MREERTSRIDYDGLYKKALGTAATLAQFLQTFDSAMAEMLRLDTVTPYGNELFDRVPVDYRRRADIVARVAQQDAAA